MLSPLFALWCMLFSITFLEMLNRLFWWWPQHLCACLHCVGSMILDASISCFVLSALYFIHHHAICAHEATISSLWTCFSLLGMHVFMLLLKLVYVHACVEVYKPHFLCFHNTVLIGSIIGADLLCCTKNAALCSVSFHKMVKVSHGIDWSIFTMLEAWCIMIPFTILKT